MFKQLFSICIKRVNRYSHSVHLKTTMLESYWLCFLLSVIVYNVQSARVHTIMGEFDGGLYKTNNDKRVFTFLGIPYAEPPVGRNRFEKPIPRKREIGVRLTKKFKEPCVQFKLWSTNPNELNGSEDCLYLNVYTPNLSAKANLPVLVYFHGGQFMVGETHVYNPNRIMEGHDIVFVSINYRLGPFGFLSTEDEIVPGNNGLKDQVLALNWIQENIKSFGGDPNQVTISGNSAGGASVHYHYLSPLSRGLFSKGIISSGSALMPWALTIKPLMKTKKLAEAVACPTDSTDKIVNCLRDKTKQEIMAPLKNLLMTWQLDLYMLSGFGPVIEPPGNDAFLSIHPYRLIKRGEIFDGPLLISLTTEEGLYPSSMFINREDRLKYLNDHWNDLAPHLLEFNNTVPSTRLNDVSQEIKKHYFGEEPIRFNNAHKLTKMLGDRLYYGGMDLAVRLQVEVMKSPVYMFTLGYRGSISLSDPFTSSKGNFGVSHCDDLYYLLSSYGYSRLISKESDQSMVLALTNIWGSFVQTGKPSPRAGVVWEPVHEDLNMNGKLNFLEILSPYDMKMSMKSNNGDYEFWSSLGLNENENFWSSYTTDIDLGLEIKLICDLHKKCKKVLVTISYADF